MNKIKNMKQLKIITGIVAVVAIIIFNSGFASIQKEKCQDMENFYVENLPLNLLFQELILDSSIGFELKRENSVHLYTMARFVQKSFDSDIHLDGNNEYITRLYIFTGQLIEEIESRNLEAGFLYYTFDTLGTLLTENISDNSGEIEEIQNSENIVDAVFVKSFVEDVKIEKTETLLPVIKETILKKKTEKIVKTENIASVKKQDIKKVLRKVDVKKIETVKKPVEIKILKKEEVDLSDTDEEQYSSIIDFENRGSEIINSLDYDIDFLLN